VAPRACEAVEKPPRAHHYPAMMSDSTHSIADNTVSEPSPTEGVTVNGEARQVAPGTSVQGLLLLLGLEPTKIAVERNLEIVPKSQYEATILSEGDRIEIVQFVGGG